MTHMYRTKFDYKGEKCSWCACDLSPGPQNGRCIHRAIAAPILFTLHMKIVKGLTRKGSQIIRVKTCSYLGFMELWQKMFWAVAGPHWVERSIPLPEVLGSNPVIGKNLY